MDRNREILVDGMVDIQIRGIRKLTLPPKKVEKIIQKRIGFFNKNITNSIY